MLAAWSSRVAPHHDGHRDRHVHPQPLTGARPYLAPYLASDPASVARFMSAREICVRFVAAWVWV